MWVTAASAVRASWHCQHLELSLSMDKVTVLFVLGKNLVLTTSPGHSEAWRTPGRRIWYWWILRGLSTKSKWEHVSRFREVCETTLVDKNRCAVISPGSTDCRRRRPGPAGAGRRRAARGRGTGPRGCRSGRGRAARSPPAGRPSLSAAPGVWTVQTAVRIYLATIVLLFYKLTTPRPGTFAIFCFF